MIMPDSTRTYYFLDWCPFNTIPIENKLFGYGKYKKGLLDGDKGILRDQRVSELFMKFPELNSIEYACRLDGIFMFRLDILDSNKMSIITMARDISDFIKCAHGHSHDFHSCPKEKDESLSVIQAVQSFLFGDHSESINRSFHISPIETEDPFSDSFQQEGQGTITSLDEFLDPKHDPSHLCQLRANIKPINPRTCDQIACLRLRARYARVKDKCTPIVMRVSQKGDITFFLLLREFIVFALSFFTMWAGLSIGLVTSITFSIVIAVAVYVFIDLRNSGVRELGWLKRAIGFYSYAAILSLGIEAIFSRAEITSETINTRTDNFQNVKHILQARYDIEKQKVDHRRYVMRTAFSIVALTFVALKFVIEVERIPEYFEGAIESVISDQEKKTSLGDENLDKVEDSRLHREVRPE